MPRILLSALATLFFLSAPVSAQVVVSSKIDTEGSVLGNMIIEVLQHNGIETRDRTQLGNTQVVRQAIEAGEIDIYPEYTGNAAVFFNEPDDSLWTHPGEAYEKAKSLDYEANRIVWLTPAPASNTWAIAVRHDLAQQHSLQNFSSFANWVNQGGEVKLVASSEFVNSAQALPAFQKAYGFELSSNQLIVLSGGDTAATIRAAAQETSGANAAMVYSTDGAIMASGLQVLEDDKEVQPIYQPTAIIRESVLEQYPQIAELLEPVFEALTLATLQQLNAEVQVEGRSAKDVAHDFLSSNGLLDD